MCVFTWSVWVCVLPCRILHLGRTEAGRQAIVDTLHLCGSAASALPDQEAVLGLQNEVIGTFQGLAQVRGQRGRCPEMLRWVDSFWRGGADGHCLVPAGVSSSRAV